MFKMLYILMYFRLIQGFKIVFQRDISTFLHFETNSDLGVTSTLFRLDLF